MNKLTKKTLKRAVILLIIASLMFGCCACSGNKGEVLAEQVKVGDYVNYNAASGDGEDKIYTVADGSLTGSNRNSVFMATDPMRWKVMSVDKESGTVELMADDPTPDQLTLCGATGYKNAEKVLNDISAVYGYGDGATGGRSLTIEDVNKLENYTPEESTVSYTYTFGTFINEDGTESEATEDNPVTMGYTASTAEKSTNRAYGYETTNFSEKTFFLASRCISLYPDVCAFVIQFMKEGSVNFSGLIDSLGFDYEPSYPVLPVVTLKANIRTSGQDKNGAWNLVIE